MLTAIDFDNRPPIRAQKIDNIRTKRHLLSETGTIKLLSTQFFPERFFSLGAILTQLSSVQRTHVTPP